MILFQSFLTSQSSDFSRNFKGFFACSALFNFQDTSWQLFALQLLHYITFRTFCQVNNLWTRSDSFELISTRPYLSPTIRWPLTRPVVWQLIHSITFQAFCQVNNLWMNLNSRSSFYSFFTCLSLSCDSFIIISHLFTLVKLNIFRVLSSNLANLYKQ